MGMNSRPMGACTSLATALGFATEYQGKFIPHGPRFVSLENMYGTSPEEILQLDTNLVAHLERTHYVSDEHYRISLRIQKKICTRRESPYMWAQT